MAMQLSRWATPPEARCRLTRARSMGRAVSHRRRLGGSLSRQLLRHCARPGYRSRFARLPPTTSALRPHGLAARRPSRGEVAKNARHSGRRRQVVTVRSATGKIVYQSSGGAGTRPSRRRQPSSENAAFADAPDEARQLHSASRCADDSRVRLLSPGVEAHGPGKPAASLTIGKCPVLDRPAGGTSERRRPSFAGLRWFCKPKVGVHFSQSTGAMKRLSGAHCAMPRSTVPSRFHCLPKYRTKLENLCRADRWCCTTPDAGL